MWCTAATICAAGWVPAQTYSVRATVSQPGGLSTGGVYGIRGVVDNAGSVGAGGAVEGGAYTVMEGLLGVYLVQNPVGPRLGIRRLAAGGLQLFWPATASAYGLEVCGDLVSPDWHPAPEAEADDGTWITVDIQPNGLPTYYRLAAPVP